MTKTLSGALPALAGILAPSFALASLMPGDIAIIGFNFDDPDELAFVALSDLPAGEVIKFTDNGWKSDNTFRTGEGIFTYTVPGGGISKGTIINPPVSSVLFSATGDQILAYQGADATPTFLFAVNSEGDREWQATAADANTSAIPLGLTNNITAIALAEIDNAKFNTAVLASGTHSQWLAQIGARSNWAGDDATRQTLPSGSIVVNAGTGAVTNPITTYSFTGAAGNEVAIGPDAQPGRATSSLLSRGNGVNPTATAGTINSTNWSALFTADEFYTFSIAPEGANTMMLTGIEFKDQASASGPTTWEVRSSLDNFTAVLVTGSTHAALGTNSFSLTGPFTLLSSGVEFRLYGYVATGASGTFRLDDVKILGIVYIPEPVIAGLFPAAALLMGRRRKA